MIDKVKSECTGCTACVCICPVHAIKMSADEEGFLYPAVDGELCVDCGKCEACCPVNRHINTNPVMKAYAAEITDIDARKQSSSGGIFTAIAEWILSEGGVVLGAAYTDGLTVHHVAVESPSDLASLRMSKYVQSDVSGTFALARTYLEQGRYVLYSGTPCQIAGLVSYLDRDYDRLVLLDIVCHGVPSPKVFEEFKASIEKRYGSRITDICFRSKVIGYSLSTVAVLLEDGRLIHSRRLVKSYTKLWFKGYISRPSCHECTFKTMDRASDFTLFDSFKTEKALGVGKDDMGVTNVFVRTNKADGIWREISEKIEFVESKAELMEKLDGDMILNSAFKNENRDAFWNQHGRLGYPELVEKFVPYGIKERIMDALKRVIVSSKINRIPLVKKMMRKMK